MTQHEPFSQSSLYYDTLYGDRDICAEVDFVLKHLELAPGARILDLGCGTGAHLLELVRRGFMVDGIDRSPHMLEIARQKVAGLDSNQRSAVSLQCCDAGTAQLNRTYDGVIALFHVLSYQTDNGALSAFLGSVCRHLRPGARFVCDFWYGEAVELEGCSVRTRRFDYNCVELSRVAVPNQLPGNVVEVGYSFDVPTNSPVDSNAQTTRSNSRVSETHRMRYFFIDELTEFASNNGLRLTATGAWLSALPPSADCWAAYIVGERL